MKRIAYVLVAIALFPLTAMGQRYLQEQKPFWADGYFHEMNNSYLEVVNASGYELEDARNRAVKEVISRRSMATGTQATVSMHDNDINNIVSEKNEGDELTWESILRNNDGILKLIK